LAELQGFCGKNTTCEKNRKDKKIAGWRFFLQNSLQPCKKRRGLPLHKVLFILAGFNHTGMKKGVSSLFEVDKLINLMKSIFQGGGHGRQDV